MGGEGGGGAQTLASFLTLARARTKARSWIPGGESPHGHPYPAPPHQGGCAPGLVLKARQSLSYMAEGVQVVVCELQLLEGDELPHPVGPSGRRIRVDIEPSWHGGLGLPCHHPANRADRTTAADYSGVWKSPDSLPPLRANPHKPWGGAGWESLLILYSQFRALGL